MEGRTGSLSSISVLSEPQGGQDWPVVAPTWSQLGNREGFQQLLSPVSLSTSIPTLGVALDSVLVVHFCSWSSRGPLS